MHHPTSGAQAQFSVAFSVAVAVLEGNASIFQYTDERLASEPVRDLMARIVVRADPKLDTHYPAKRAASAEIALKGGRNYRGSIDNAKGEPEQPLGAADIANKFVSLTKGVLKERTEQVRDRIMALETVSDVGELVAELHG
jgi:2-methylcitrate dehydratase PrpD